MEDNSIEFIPGLGYESVNLNATLVLTAMRAAEDRPLKINRSILSNWPLTAFTGLLEVYMDFMFI